LIHFQKLETPTWSLLIVFLLGLFVAPFVSAREAKDFPSGPVGTDPPPELTLVWLDEQLPIFRETMTREVERIFGDIGVNIRWKVVQPDSVYRLGLEDLNLHVFLQDVSLRAVRGRERPVMGAVNALPGDGRWIFMSFPGVLETLGLTPSSTTLHRIDVKHEISTALGRVLAHEIVHVIDPDIPHASDGLMCASLGQWVLTRGRPRLGSCTAARVLARLRSFRKNTPAAP
jgi:hypothetical protein